MEEGTNCVVCLGDKPSPVILFENECKCNLKIHPECLHIWLEKNEEGCSVCKTSVTEAITKEKAHKKFRFYCNTGFASCIVGCILTVFLTMLL